MLFRSDISEGTDSLKRSNSARGIKELLGSHYTYKKWNEVTEYSKRFNIDPCRKLVHKLGKCSYRYAINKEKVIHQIKTKS